MEFDNPFWTPHPCAKNNVACQHSQQTRRWPNAGPMLAHSLRYFPSINPALVQRLVFAGSCVQLHAGLVVLTASGTNRPEYKPTPPQCLLNAGPASLVLASIHSALVSGHAVGTGMMLWIKAGLMLAHCPHIQRGAKHNKVTQYWANVGSAWRTVGKHYLSIGSMSRVWPPAR